MSAYDAATATCSAWTVVHGPRVAVRGAPSVTAPCVGARKEGEVVRPIGVVDGWLPSSESGFTDEFSHPAPLWRIHTPQGWNAFPLHELVESVMNVMAQ